MFTLLHEVHFWTQKDGVFIKDLDFGAFMYCEKKHPSQCLLFEGKKSYAEGRGINWSLSNKRPKKLKDSLKEFEEFLYNNRVLSFTWRNPISIQIVFSNGLIVYLQVNPSTADIEEIIYDKFMVGKLNHQYISDVTLSASHCVFAYTDNQVTLGYFTKPALKYGLIKKWNSLDVRIQNSQLAGPTGRRLDKQLSLNSTGDLISVWWKSSNDEVYPWSPIVRDEDRANVHIYSLNEGKLNLICYYRTEFEPISIIFSTNQPSVIHTLQQKISKKSEVSIEWSTAEVGSSQLEINYMISLLIPTHSCVVSLSPKEDKLFVACIDGSLLIADSYGNIINNLKAAFIPSLATWHPDSCLFLIGNERGQLQWFDSYLNCVRCQFTNEDASPSAVLDIGSYFKYQPTLLSMQWNRHSHNSDLTSDHDDLLLLQYERGPVVVVRLITGGGEKKLSADTVIAQYLWDGNYEKAVNLLYSLDWEHEGEIALASLQFIVSHMIRQPLTPEREIILEKALGSYHSPVRPIPQSITNEYGDTVHDLSRRFFHHLLRYQVFEKAFRLAIDLDDYDLFMDIHNYCKKIGNSNMATAALERAEEIMYSSESGSSCDCSESSCSDSPEPQRIEIQQKRIYTPPLPLLYTPKPAPRNRVKFPHRIPEAKCSQIPSTSKVATIPEISPNAVGIPTIEDFAISFYNKTKLNHQKPHLFSTTSFISDVNESPTVFDKKPPPYPRVAPNQPEQGKHQKENGNHQKENGKHPNENGKIKVVHFGLV